MVVGPHAGSYSAALEELELGPGTAIEPVKRMPRR
jgi:hypothetical protein